MVGIHFYPVVIVLLLINILIKLYFLVTYLLAAINKLIQISMFITYIVYYIKFNKKFDGVQTSTLHNRNLFRIAIVMGATIGLSQFVFIFLVFDSEIVDAIIGSSGALLLAIQQCVIMMSFLSSEKISGLCKNLFSRERES